MGTELLRPHHYIREKKVKIRDFGKTKDGREAKLFTLTNGSGFEVDITDFGAIVQSIRVPFKDGTTDVVLGYDSAAGYENGTEYIGSTVGRTCGQVEGGEFSIGNAVYLLTQNLGEHNMHGGEKGFSYTYFEAVEPTRDDELVLKRFSPDGEEGFPGNLELTVTYRLTDDYGLEIHFDAVTDKTTIVDVTNHSYFNLDGWDSDADCLDHWLMIDADSFCDTDNIGMPTGAITEVEGTPMDFRTPHQVGERIEDPYPQLHTNDGYDHNYNLNEDAIREGRPVASVENAARTHRLEVITDYPGVQLYTGNSLRTSETDLGKGGKPFRYRQALCLETQFPTNAMAHPEFPSIILMPGEKYSKTCIYRFKI